MRIDIYDSSDSDSGKYRNAMTEQCRKLEIDLDIGTPPAQPPATLTLVFANENSRWTQQQEDALQDLVGRSSLVLPVIENGPAAEYLPRAVGMINAFKKNDTGDTAWADSLVDETLSMAWLKRRTRKVFISYRRIDSAPIARQIFGRFNELGYNVFLDDASIDRGVEFQRELKWWLNDADLLLALCSPYLGDSQWCMEELTFAQSHSIGIAAVEWPKERYKLADEPPRATHRPTRVLLDLTMPDQHLPITMNDFVEPETEPEAKAREPKKPLAFEERVLSAEALERLVAFCARQRAASIRSRLNNLVPLVQDALSRRKFMDVSHVLGDFTFKDKNGKPCFLRALPFRPLPEHLRQAYIDSRRPDLSVCLCAYAECDVKDARAEALRWFAEKAGTGTKDETATNSLWAFCGGILL